MRNPPRPCANCKGINTHNAGCPRSNPSRGAPPTAPCRRCYGKEHHIAGCPRSPLARRYRALMRPCACCRYSFVAYTFDVSITCCPWCRTLCSTLRGICNVANEDALGRITLYRPDPIVTRAGNIWPYGQPTETRAGAANEMHPGSNADDRLGDSRERDPQVRSG